MRTAILGVLLCAVLWPRAIPAAPPDPLFAPPTSSGSLADAFTPQADAPLRIVAMLHPAHAFPGGRVTLRLEGSLAAGFYVYAGPTLPTPGPDAIRVEWSAAPATPVGPPRAAPPRRIRDAVYEVEADVYVGAFWIEQTLALPSSLTPGPHSVAGQVAYQVCDGRICSITQRLPFEVQLTVD